MTPTEETLLKSCFDMLRSHEIDFASPTFAEGIDLASNAKYAIPMTSTNYKILPFDDPEMRVTVRGVWRANDENPALHTFVRAMIDTCERVDLSMYWR